MSRRTCPRVTEMTEIERRGGDLGRLREHIEACRSCREAVAVTKWLGEVSATTLREVTAPSPESIWWRSEVVRKLCDRDDREYRRAKPLDWIQVGGVALAAVTVVSIVFGDNLIANGLFQRLTGLVGGSGAVVVAIAAVVSLATGALIAWQATQELG